MKKDSLYINGWFVVSLCLLIGVLICIEDHEAQVATENDSYYMVVGLTDLNFDCVSELPYRMERRMDWNADEGLTELDNDYRLHYWIIEVELCDRDWETQSKFKSVSPTTI